MLRRINFLFLTCAE